MKYDKCRKLLRERQSGLKCREVLRILSDLGFKVRDGKGGHKMYRHPEIQSFSGGNFNCGHGDGAEVKKPYITSIASVIDEYEMELRKALGE